MESQDRQSSKSRRNLRDGLGQSGVLSHWRRWVGSFAGAAGIGLAGCGLLAPGGPTVETAVVGGGPILGHFTDTVAVVRVAPQSVVIEYAVGYGQPSYDIRAAVSQRAGGLVIEVDTEANDNAVEAHPWFIKYRLTVSSVAPGDQRLQLTWRNRFNPPLGRVRTPVDTLINVPK